MVFSTIFEQILNFIFKISFDQNQFKFLHNIRAFLFKIIIKMKKFLLVIFGIWSETLYYGTRLWPDFRATLKICKISNFDQNQFKFSMQQQYKYISNNEEFSLLVNFGRIWPITMHVGYWPEF